MDLSLIPRAELVNEISRRYSTSIVYGVGILDKGEERHSIHAWHGDPVSAIYGIVRMQFQIMSDMRSLESELFDNE